MAAGAFSYADYLRDNEDALRQIGAPAPAAAAAADPASSGATSPYAMLESFVSNKPAEPPAPPAPATPPPAMPPPAQAEAPRARSPYAAIEQISQQQVASQNQIGDSILREGDIKADAAKRRADKIGASTAKQQGFLDDSEKNHAENRARQEQIKTWMDEDLRKLRDPILDKRSRSQKTASVITAVVGAMAASDGGMGGQGLAAGMGMLNDHVNRSFAEQLDARDQAGQNLEHNQRALATLAKDSHDEIDAASKLAANQWIVTSHELDQISEEAKSPIEKETAKRLAIASYDNGRDILRRNYERRIAAQQAATTARAKAAKDAEERERQRVKDALDADKTMAETDKIRAEAAKAQREGLPMTDAEGSSVASTGARTDQQQVEFDKRASAYDGLRPHLMNLSSLANKSGKEAKAMFGASADAAGALLSVARGQGQQGEAERKAAWTGLISPATWDSWDTYSDEERQRIANEAIRTIEDEVSGSLATYRGTIPQERRLSRPDGWNPREQEAGPPAPPARAPIRGPAAAPKAPAAPAVVRMIRDADGKVISVPANRVGAARNSGFRLPDEMSQEQANAPLAADDAENARIEQALASVGG